MVRDHCFQHINKDLDTTKTLDIIKNIKEGNHTFTRNALFTFLTNTHAR